MYIQRHWALIDDAWICVTCWSPPEMATYPCEASTTLWTLFILVDRILGSLEFPASVITTDFLRSVQNTELYRHAVSAEFLVCVSTKNLFRSFQNTVNIVKPIMVPKTDMQWITLIAISYTSTIILSYYTNILYHVTIIHLQGN